MGNSGENLQSLFDTIGDLIFVADRQSRIRHVNRAVIDKLGYSRDELLGMNLLQLHPLERRDQTHRLLQALFREEITICPLELESKCGARFQVETRAWNGTWGETPCTIGISKDVSGEREALRVFTELFECNPALMAIGTIPDGRYLEINEMFLEKLGYEREEVIGQTSSALGIFVDPDLPCLTEWQDGSGGRVQNVELQIRRKDGKILVGKFSGGLIDCQGKRYCLTTMVDISDQVELVKRVEIQKRKLENIIDGTRLGTWEWNVQSGEAVFNERWAQIVGYTLQELQPVSIATWEALAHPDDLRLSNQRLQEHFSHASEYYQCEIRMKHKNGGWVKVLDRGRVVDWDGDGRPLTMFGTHAANGESETEAKT